VNNKRSWVIHGPQASGKTTHAKELAAMLGLRKIVDDWDGTARTFVKLNALHLTNASKFLKTSSTPTMHITEALLQLNKHRKSKS